MNEQSIQQLLQSITNLKVDITLYADNPGRCLRFNLDDLPTDKAKKVVISIIRSLYCNSSFWVCEFGSNTGRTLVDNQIVNVEKGLMIVPYMFTRRDYFEYDSDAIACAQVCLDKLSLQAYIDFAFRLEFLSNTIFLIDPVREIALYIYDRRGMDVVSSNLQILEKLRHDYQQNLLI